VTRDGHVVRAAHGSIRIEGDALAGLVVRSAESVDGARVRRPRRGLTIAVADGRARVELELAVRYGTPLPALAAQVQERIASALRDSAGLEVEAVDVTVEELDR
jgi:uncharacterized alkaline shock family protein YloU